LAFHANADSVAPKGCRKKTRRKEPLLNRHPHRPRDPIIVRRVMSAVRSTNNRAERLLRLRLWAVGLRYRKYRPDLPGRPDIVFGPTRVAVFVDGDFWHARDYVEGGILALRRGLRTSRSDWWVQKLRANALRDARNTKELRSQGFLVVRVWEKDVLRNLEKIASRIRRVVHRRTTRQNKGGSHGGRR
jgi:DNA mismatch endonuclease (patch repair protein)